MRVDASLTTAKRPEREFAKSWGLYSAKDARWLDVLFATEREALDALTVLAGGRRSRR